MLQGSTNLTKTRSLFQQLWSDSSPNENVEVQCSSLLSFNAAKESSDVAKDALVVRRALSAISAKPGPFPLVGGNVHKAQGASNQNLHNTSQNHLKAPGCCNRVVHLHFHSVSVIQRDLDFSRAHLNKIGKSCESVFFFSFEKMTFLHTDLREFFLRGGFHETCRLWLPENLCDSPASQKV